MSAESPRILIDPSTGRPVLMAPRRQGRPHNTHAAALAQEDANVCPFCPGQEHQTPPEVDAIRPSGSQADQSGWTMRAFHNLYPASPWHEVVAEGHRHAIQPTALDAESWGEAITLYQRRIRTLESMSGVRTAYWFKNVGAAAGASMAHNHSQILGLPMLPPRLELEQAQNHKLGMCVHCDDLLGAASEDRVVWRGLRHVLLVPRVPKLPHETWLLPLEHRCDFLTDPAQELGRALHTLFCSVALAFKDPPLNLYLHRIPDADFHWHFELQPRTGQVAGLELGGDMYINSVPPQQSARRLRDALAR